ncbi:hypothetical protein BDR07DRAFT_988284 [Suillus spraguei]|nr:hypothetical protein BDR07DRAFT_988284 [Suillus spraguei]
MVLLQVLVYCWWSRGPLGEGRSSKHRSLVSHSAPLGLCRSVVLFTTSCLARDTQAHSRVYTALLDQMNTSGLLVSRTRLFHEVLAARTYLMYVQHLGPWQHETA